MCALKARVYEICHEVASEFPGWTFVSGNFKNKSLKHSTLIINLGFSFRYDTPVQPAIFIEHKKSMDLFKKLNGYELPTSIVNFQNLANQLVHIPEELRLRASIIEDRTLHVALVSPSEEAQRRIVDVSDCRPFLRSVMLDGIDLIERLYDFSSEENFLDNLPPKYTPRSDKIPYDEFERQKGVMMCIVRALLGDFEFVEKYQSDSYQTIFPKRTKELENLAAAMPDLRRLYTKSG